MVVGLLNQDFMMIVDGRVRHDLNDCRVTISKSHHRSVFLRFGKSKISRNLIRFPLTEIGRSESAGS